MSGVLHVVSQLSRGGAGRSIVNTVAALAARPDAHSHAIVSLRPGDVEMAARARAAGAPVLDAPAADALRAEIAGADVVHVHFWNSPELQVLLRSPLPPARLAIWCHVGGGAAPQVITPEVVALADRFVPSTPISLELPALGGAEDRTVIADVMDPGRIAGIERREHDGFAVGYVGTVDPVKMHSGFVELCAAVDVPGARFVVCGSGGGFAALAARAEELGVRDRFELRGYVEDVGSVLAELDVFGYPLCPGNYGAAELVVQEAMCAGVPPVVLPHGGAAATVTDGETGIVAADERAYVAAIERLAADARLRRRLGEAGRAHAERSWTPAVIAAAWTDVYAELLERPKRTRPEAPAAGGAELFVACLGDRAGAFRDSLDASDPEAALAADGAIASVPPVVVGADGGVLDYRRRFPDDPHLRLWLGLALRGQGRNALAAGELAAALRLGLDPRRAGPALAAVTEELGHHEVARRALDAVPAAAGAEGG